MAAPKSVYQLKITLKGSKPPIWRRVLVPENATLFSLHEIIQQVMGWQDYHLHAFTIAGQIYGSPEDDEYDDFGTKNETRYRLSKLGLREKAKFSYEYDFGDSWEHTILVEKITGADPAAVYPVCIAGKRAAPPEDSGGIWGYENLMQVIADPAHEDHEEMLEWLGDDFDPEEFDLDDVNAALQQLKPARKRRKSTKEEPEEDNFTPPTADQEAVAESMAVWLRNLSMEELNLFDALPLRRNLLVFLDYLSKNRTVGTQSTGNLPLKAVTEISQKFVGGPPALEETLHKHTYKVRSEDDVWSLLFVHSLAVHSDLVTGGPSKTWKVTTQGELLPQLPPPIQILFLFSSWWIAMDWVIAFPVSGLADGLPPLFQSAALACLNELSTGENTPFEAFADRVIAQSGLTWPSKDQTNTHLIMQAVVKRLVVDIMEDFGILECEYLTESQNGYEHKELTHIRMTTNGKKLLDLSSTMPEIEKE